METRKIAIIGTGHVGAHVAYTLMMQGLVNELLLIDQDEQKVASECQDLRDAAMYCPYHVNVHVADYSELKDVPIIVNAIGKVILLETLNRWTELEYTIEQVGEVIPKVMASGFHGKIVSITNPCDIITRQVSKLSGLPWGHVFGTGTGLDTSRLISALSMQTGVDHRSISAYMMGEHGDKQMVPWSLVTFGGMPLSAMAEKDPRFVFDRDAMQKKAIGGGWATFVGKKCTEYGIAATAARVIRVMVNDEKQIIPASIELRGEYGESGGLFCGVPCIVGKDGVERIVELPLTAEEQIRFHECCEGIRENMTKNDKILK